MINFFKGHPTNSLMPSLEILQASQNVLLQAHENPDQFKDDPVNRSPLQYGTDPGNLETRQVLADWVNEWFGLGAGAGVGTGAEGSSASVSNGASHTSAEGTDPTSNPTPTNHDDGALGTTNDNAGGSATNASAFASAPVLPTHINLTAGASYGIMNILTQTTSPHNNYTRKAFIITPTYYLINGAFIDAGFGSGKLASVDELDDGQIDLDGLVRMLDREEHSAIAAGDVDAEGNAEGIAEGIKEKAGAKGTSTKSNATTGTTTTTFGKDSGTTPGVDHLTDPSRVAKKFYRYVIYLIPSFSNPKGGVLNYANRVKLIEIAREYDMLIISDDVYDLLDYTNAERPIPRLTMIDRITCPSHSHGNTVSNATFSKLICPGLRAGWQETCNEHLAYQLSQGGANKSGGTPSQLNISIVQDLIETKVINKIIENFKTHYRERSIVLKKLIKENLPIGTKIFGGNGGYFLWITMPSGIDAREMCALCKQQGVILANGDEFEVTGDHKHWGKTSVRLSISYLTIDEIIKGVEIWSNVCNQMLKKN